MDALSVFLAKLNLQFLLLMVSVLVQLLVLWKLRLMRVAMRLTAGLSPKQPTEASAEGGTSCNGLDPFPLAAEPKTDAATGESENTKPRRLRFVMDSLFLAASYRYVSSREEEVFHYVAGVRVDETTCCLIHIVPVEFSEQSVSGVRVADASNISTLARLDNWGLPLLAHVHSHPAVGPGGTTPSATDRRFTRRLAQGGHIAVGIIVSRDAYVRFYADTSVEFTVDVRGNHVRKVEENVYAIDTQLADSDFPLLKDPPRLPERGWSSRSPGRGGRV